jgi:hypothetical protein
MRPTRLGRRQFGALTVGAFGAAAVSAQVRAQSNWTSLWNGKDLSEWTTWLARPEPSSNVAGAKRDAKGAYTEPIGANRDPLNIFTVVPNVDGAPAIRISGEVFGELRTKGSSFRDYHLTLQFKWGQKKWPPRDADATPRDSGLLYHVHAEPGAQGRTWARSIELQIQERDVGDLYAVGSAIAVRAKPRAGTSPALFEYDPTGDWTYFTQMPGFSGRCVKMPDAEKPTGEWNTVELVCLGEECLHIVNGKVVMRLYGPMQINSAVPSSVTSGAIILQSEGAELFYRDIRIRSISSIPREFA